MMRVLYYILIAVTLVWTIGCVPPEVKSDQYIEIDLSAPELQTIYNLQDRRDVDSLLTYLESASATERFIAAQGLASAKDKVAIPALSDLLITDPSEDVRQAAAYAIGQIGDPSTEQFLISSFAKQDTSSFNTSLRATILEAVGKCGSVGTLATLADVKRYTNADDQLLLGQARSIYRFAQRGITEKLASQVMIERVLDRAVPQATRRMAGQFLSRYTPDITDYKQRLVNLLATESDAEVRMNIATALGKSGDREMLPILMTALSKDTDYRVRCNVIRQLDSYNYYEYKDSIMALIDDPNQHVANLAIELIKAQGDRRDAGELLTKAKTITDIRKKADVLGAAISRVPSGYVNTRSLINKEIVDGLTIAKSPYDKAAYIKALALDPINYEVFKAAGLNATDPVLLTTAIGAIPDLIGNERTVRIYRRGNALEVFKRQVMNDLIEVMGKGDIGAVAGIAGLVRDESLNFKSVIDTILPFQQALDAVDMPGDVETAYELMDAIAFLQDTTPVVRTLPAYNHPINWDRLDNLSDSSHAVIITTRGQIEVQLYTTSAPATIANFAELTNTNYYDGKSIHRVVPNFVVQGGCPRGDGYGGLGYTIRSDVAQHYYDAPGYIGMASAGPDTEGTQWFITHSAAPHLDGRYTIFGKVRSGMDVVHAIQVGDIIQDVRILKFR